MPVFEPIPRISLFFINISNFIGNIYPVRYAVLLKGQLLLSNGVNLREIRCLIKGTAYVISWGEPFDKRCILKTEDFVTYIEIVSGTEIMNVRQNIQRDISRRNNKKYVVTTIDLCSCEFVELRFYGKRNGLW